MKLLLSLLSALLLALLSSCTTEPRQAGTVPPQASQPFTGDYIEVEDADTSPKITKPLRVKYPHAMKRAGIQGNATVAFIIDKSGRPRQARAISATNGQFAAAAVAAVENLRFEPALKNGVPVNVLIKYPITFSIREH